MGNMGLVSKDQLRDQGDALYYMAEELFDDVPEIKEALLGAGNMLLALYTEFEFGNSSVTVRDGGKRDNEFSHDQLVAAVRRVKLSTDNDGNPLDFYWTEDGYGITSLMLGSASFDDDDIWRLLINESSYSASFRAPELVNIYTSISSNRGAHVTVEDSYWQVDDAEANRTFAIVHAEPGVDDSGIDFEEL